MLLNLETHMENINKGIEQKLFTMIGETDFFERLGLLGRPILPPTHHCTLAPRHALMPHPLAPFNQQELRDHEFLTAANHITAELAQAAEVLGVEPMRHEKGYWLFMVIYLFLCLYSI